MGTLEKIKQVMVELESDTTKFFTKGNYSAGTRARKTSQVLKELLQQLREDILAERKKEGEKNV